jgi:hypothetical protein
MSLVAGVEKLAAESPRWCERSDPALVAHERHGESRSRARTVDGGIVVVETQTLGLGKLAGNLMTFVCSIPT